MSGPTASSSPLLSALYAPSLTDLPAPRLSPHRHFTQLVWKASTQIGCAVSIGPFQGYQCAVVACEYTVEGNMVSNSAFFANVA